MRKDGTGGDVNGVDPSFDAHFGHLDALFERVSRRAPRKYCIISFIYAQFRNERNIARSSLGPDAVNDFSPETESVL